LQDSVIAFSFSIIIATPFLLSMVALHYTVPEEKKFRTNAAVALAVIYATYCTLNYTVQLATVIPAGYSWTFENQQGTMGPLSLLNQTPHSLFWDIDALLSFI
jgi:NO-binding membrane sensor protein with MHYT domain